MPDQNDISFNGLRLKHYTSTTTDDGKVAQDVWMDQYGRIMERRTNRKTKKVDWEPTGRCGYAKH